MSDAYVTALQLVAMTIGVLAVAFLFVLVVLWAISDLRREARDE
jgi:cbb3-type cytochrome oxidase subunit 3